MNPHKQGPTPPKPRDFDVSLFQDVYKAYEKEYGKEFMGKHVGMAALYLTDAGVGRIEISGTLQLMQFLLCMLTVRLAQTQSTQVKLITKGQRNPSMRDCAAELLRSVQVQIDQIAGIQKDRPAPPPPRPDSGIARPQPGA